MNAAVLAVTLGLASMMACSGSPAGPSEAPALKSIRYVRTLPVAYPGQSTVILHMEHPSARCFGCQGSSGTDVTYASLTQIDSTTFEDPFASLLRNIPVYTDVAIYMTDEAVSLNYVASDVYVNGTKVSVTRAGQQEYRHFRLTSGGVVY